MLEQVEGRTNTEIKHIIVEACCGEESKLISLFRGKGRESVKLDFTKHENSKDYTIEAIEESSINVTTLEVECKTTDPVAFTARDATC